MDAGVNWQWNDVKMTQLALTYNDVWLILDARSFRTRPIFNAVTAAIRQVLPLQMSRGTTGSSCRIALTTNLLSQINSASDERTSPPLFSHVGAVRFSQSCRSTYNMRSINRQPSRYKLLNVAVEQASSCHHSFNYFGSSSKFRSFS
jgi:hypothetical protein